jgi:hypothetical protein
MSRSGGTTLYVTGFGHGTRARDLAYEFERYVPVVDDQAFLDSPTVETVRPLPPRREHGGFDHDDRCHNVLFPIT